MNAEWEAAHDEQHRIGIPEFERRYNLDLRERAQQLAKLYDTTREFTGGAAPSPDPKEPQ